MRSARATTSEILDQMDMGMLDPLYVAKLCLNWMSEAEVHEMARYNDIIEDDEDE